MGPDFMKENPFSSQKGQRENNHMGRFILLMADEEGVFHLKISLSY